MPKAALYNTKGETIGEVELNDAIFGADVNEGLMHEAVLAYLTNQRVGTQSTKTRSEVRGGGRKPWRQKGLGRARAGTIRSPLWRKGGIVFGPKPRDFQVNLPKKARRAALRSALSAKLAAGEIKVVDGLAVDAPKTKVMAEILANLKVEKALVVTVGRDENLYLSARNIAGVDVSEARNLNVYQILAHRDLVITKEAVAKVEEVLA
ncbi:MAG: 50S ribosomal protein L4 [Bacillota bacterium]